MLLLALAIAPGIAVCLFIWSLHKMGTASMRCMISCFVLGAVVTLLPLAVQLLAGDVHNGPWRHSILSYIWYVFGVVALSEEGSKFLALRLYAYPKAIFREPFDGILYAVAIGMGFATVENIEYVRQFGLETAVSRMFLSIPAHAAFAVLMGYYVGRAKFYPNDPPDGERASRPSGSRSFWLMAKGLAIAVLLHGSFDFFLFLQQNREVTRYLSTGVLSFGAFATFYIAVRLAMRALRKYRAEQAEEAEDDQSFNHKQRE